jgi:decaprenyl-diphosphate synthase subunit 2
VLSLTAAPVMFHLEHDPMLLTDIDKGLEDVQNVDYGKVCLTKLN